MSFTIKCNLCGTEQEFKNGDSLHGDNIEVDIEMEHSILGSDVKKVTIYCENESCLKWIDYE